MSKRTPTPDECEQDALDEMRSVLRRDLTQQELAFLAGWFWRMKSAVNLVPRLRERREELRATDRLTHTQTEDLRRILSAINGAVVRVLRIENTPKQSREIMIDGETLARIEAIQEKINAGFSWVDDRACDDAAEGEVDHVAHAWDKIFIAAQDRLIACGVKKNLARITADHIADLTAVAAGVKRELGNGHEDRMDRLRAAKKAAPG